MILRPWKRLAYLAFFVALLYLLFPTNTEMVLLHLQSDDPIKGERFLSEALARQPDDFDLRVLSAELHWAHGRVEPALDDLSRALSLKPANLRALILNATYLEWALRQDDAYSAWESVARRDPKRADLHLKLAAMAASLGKTKEAAAHAARWVNTSGPPPRDLASIPYFNAAWGVLSHLAGETLSGGGDELADDALYKLAATYSRSLEEHAGGGGDFKDNAARLMRICILAGLVDDASGAAMRLDKESGGFEARALLFDLMEFAGMNSRAEEAMLAMVRQAPDQEETLQALLSLGEDQGMQQAKMLALERLSRVNPDEERYRAQLIAQYVDAGRYDRIADLMDRLAWFTGSGLKYAKQVVAAAFVSGDRTFMDRVSRESERISTNDPEIISSRARLALALRDYKKGAELAQILGELAPSETAAVIKKVLEQGEYDPEAMGDALAVALSLTPEDAQLMRASALNTRARGHFDAAFSLMRRTLLISRAWEDFLLLVEFAHDASGSSASLAEALKAGDRLFARDPKYLRAASDIRLGLDDAPGAYDAQLALFRLQPDREGAARLMELAQGTGRPGDVREALDMALAAYPGDVDLIRRSTLAALADSDLPRAEAALLELLRLSPGDADALRQLADVASWTGRPALEAKTLQRLRDTGAASGQDLARLAQALEASGDGLAALDIVTGLLDKNPRDGELLRMGMQYALWNGRPGEAALLGERLCRLPGGDAWLVQTGEAWLAASEPARAAPWLERAKEAGREGGQARRLLVRVYQWLEKPGKVLEIARELEASASLTPAETLAVASAHAALGGWREAFGRLDRLRRETALDAEGELLLCRTLDRLGRRDEARAAMEAFARAHAKSAPLLVRLGEAAFAAGLRDLAGDAFRDALAAQPSNPAAMRGLATVLAEEGRPAKAAKLMDGHNRINPSDADSRIQTAELYASTGNDAKARREYKKALRLLNRPAKGVN